MDFNFENLKNISDDDQFRAAITPIAKYLAIYYQVLIAQGMPMDLAQQIVVGMHNKFTDRLVETQFGRKK